MNTGQRCQCCGLAILTNQIIIGFPVIRIIDMNHSKITGTELLFHVSCFTEKMQGLKKTALEITS